MVLFCHPFIEIKTPLVWSELVWVVLNENVLLLTDLLYDRGNIMCFAAGGVVGVKLKAVRQRRDHQIGVRCFAGEHTRFNGNPTTFCDGLQIG